MKQRLLYKHLDSCNMLKRELELTFIDKGKGITLDQFTDLSKTQRKKYLKKCSRFGILPIINNN